VFPLRPDVASIADVGSILTRGDYFYLLLTGSLVVERDMFELSAFRLVLTSHQTFAGRIAESDPR
jgi:hypothetical protein